MIIWMTRAEALLLWSGIFGANVSIFPGLRIESII
jgi:hypothetical protein